MHHDKCLNTNDSVGALKENQPPHLHEDVIILVHCYTFNVKLSTICDTYVGEGVLFVYINAVLCFQALSGSEGIRAETALVLKPDLCKLVNPIDW